MSATGASRDGGGSDDSLSEANPLYSHPYYAPVKVRARSATQMYDIGWMKSEIRFHKGMQCQLLSNTSV